MIGINIGKPEKAIGLSKIKFENFLNTVGFTSGISTLANNVLFNLLTPYDPNTNLGSNILKLIEGGGLIIQDRAQVTFLLLQEVFALEERFKSFQKNKEIPDNQILKQIQIDEIDINIPNNTLILKIKIINKLNQGVYIEV